MSTRIGYAVLPLTLVLALLGCAAPSEPTPAPSEPFPTRPDHPASGIRPAPGLYDQEDGTVRAVGILEYRDLEGGLWAIVADTGTGTEPARVVAVISNAAELERRLEKLESKNVEANGVRFEGVTIRMAGPEIEVSDIVEVLDASRPAD